MVPRFGRLSARLVGALAHYAGFAPARQGGAHAAVAALVLVFVLVLVLSGAPAAADDIAPLPPAPVVDADKARLGERLFHDHRLSGNGTVACASCHDLARAGIDGLARSVGIEGRLARRNAPTVFNALFLPTQFRDGRAATLEAQIDAPIADPNEMDTSWPDVLARLGADPTYRDAFARLYPDGLTVAAIRDAIATFERTLATPDAPFDRYLRGEAEAIGPEAKAGFALFRTLDCAACHDGPLLGGRRFARFLQDRPQPVDPGETWTPDRGRARLTGRAEDEHVFKVPSLRNVARTVPYFHDGLARTLAEVVRRMARHELGRDLAEDETRRLVAFLETLTGTWRGRPL
ncbi:MAG: c-type cytochrome [Alphaproteobacteria bacterium]|nr:c-type cytochrome [Alphaproteobacteria bacterium]